MSRRRVAERHLPVVIHLSARISTLRRFLSLDRQRKESEEELKDVCSLNRFVMTLKDLTAGTHLDLDFSNYLDLFVDNYRAQFTEQSNFLARVIEDCKGFFKTFVAPWSFPATTAHLHIMRLYCYHIWKSTSKTKHRLIHPEPVCMLAKTECV